MRRTLEIPLIAAAAASLCLAQPQQFEVASVKPTAGRELGGAYTYPGGRVAFRGCTLSYLVQLAFEIQEFQIAGKTAWMDTDRYDIDATAPAESKSSRSRPPYAKAPMNDEQRRMLQSLLAERFHLRYRRETVDGPVYLLVRNTKPLKMTDAKDKNEFPWSGSPGGGMIVGDGLAGINESMPDLAKRLSRYMGRPVLDRTGVPGSFDFRVDYPAGDARPEVTSMIATCLNDLGLKLESSRGPVERIVVESAAKPTAN